MSVRHTRMSKYFTVTLVYEAKRHLAFRRFKVILCGIYIHRVAVSFNVVTM